MSIPGAENPEKVKNIVRPQINRFRGLYFKLLREIKGISPATGTVDVSGLSGDEAVWTAMGLGKSDGSGRLRVRSRISFPWTARPDRVLAIFQQNIDPEYRAQLLKKLPRNLKKGLERAFTQRFETKVVRPGDPPAEKGIEEVEFWRKANAEADLRKVLDQGEQGVSLQIRRQLCLIPAL